VPDQGGLYRRTGQQRDRGQTAQASSRVVAFGGDPDLFVPRD
jgi:hypothetical protein